jgi:hypothetical protein
MRGKMSLKKPAGAGDIFLSRKQLSPAKRGFDNERMPFNPDERTTDTFGK